MILAAGARAGLFFWRFKRRIGSPEAGASRTLPGCGILKHAKALTHQARETLTAQQSRPREGGKACADCEPASVQPGLAGQDRGTGTQIKNAVAAPARAAEQHHARGDTRRQSRRGTTARFGAESSARALGVPALGGVRDRRA